MVKTEEDKHSPLEATYLQIPGKPLDVRKLEPLIQRLQARHQSLEQRIFYSRDVVPPIDMSGELQWVTVGEDGTQVMLKILRDPNYEASLGASEAAAEVNQRQALVGLKAVDRICEQWGLSIEEGAKLVDMSFSTWKRARKPNFSGKLSKDQLLRLSAIVGIYKALNLYFDENIAHTWIKLPNAGPLCRGARPIDVLIHGGLPAFLRIRKYLDALRGGA